MKSDEEFYNKSVRVCVSACSNSKMNTIMVGVIFLLTFLTRRQRSIQMYNNKVIYIPLLVYIIMARADCRVRTICILL